MRYERNRSSVTTGKQVSKNWKWNTHCVILHSVVVSKIVVWWGRWGLSSWTWASQLRCICVCEILFWLHCTVACCSTVLKTPMRDHCKCYTIFHFCRCVCEFYYTFFQSTHSQVSRKYFHCYYGISTEGSLHFYIIILHQIFSQGNKNIFWCKKKSYLVRFNALIFVLFVGVLNFKGF